VASAPALTVLARTPRRLGRRGWWCILALGAVCLVGGGVPLLAQAAEGGGQQDVGSLPGDGVARVHPGGRPAVMLAPAAPASRAATLGPPPARLRVPRLGVDAPVLPVSVGVDGLLGVPEDPRQLGWWSGSSRPGMPSGSIVIDGHVDSATLGLGALFREARPGDEVVLTNAAGGSARYTVAARRSYAKTSLPVAEVFAQDVSARLVLLTCGGRFDQATRHYLDNVVVYAVPR
jgi:Sortase domain